MKVLILLGCLLGSGICSKLNYPQNDCMCTPSSPVCGSDWKTYFGECIMHCQNPGASVLFQGPCANPSYRLFNNNQRQNPYLLPNPFSNSAIPSYLSPNLTPPISAYQPSINPFPSSIPFTTPSLPSPYPTPSPSPFPYSPSSNPDEIDPLISQRRSMSDFFDKFQKADKVYNVLKKGIALVKEVNEAISRSAPEEEVASEKSGTDEDNKDLKAGEDVKTDKEVKTGEDVTDAEYLKDVADVKDGEDKSVESTKDVKDATIEIKEAESKNENEGVTAIDIKEVESTPSSVTPILPIEV